MLYVLCMHTRAHACIPAQVMWFTVLAPVPCLSPLIDKRWLSNQVTQRIQEMHSTYILDLKDTHNPSWWVTLNLNISFVCLPKGTFKTCLLVVIIIIIIKYYCSIVVCFSCSQNKIYIMTKQLFPSINVL